MTYIICEPCVNTKDTACVDACPVDCIHPKKDEPDFEPATMLYINPAECIDCGACEPACAACSSASLVTFCARFHAVFIMPSLRCFI